MVMKTPEEMAEEYMNEDKVACAAINHAAEHLVEAAFIAGYKAAQLVEADKWIFVDYKTPDFVHNLPLFISRVLAVSKNGRQFITSFDHETDKWNLSEHELNKNDYIVAWTQISNPKNL
jgi:hypothetical protein